MNTPNRRKKKHSRSGALIVVIVGLVAVLAALLIWGLPTLTADHPTEPVTTTGPTSTQGSTAPSSTGTTENSEATAPSTQPTEPETTTMRLVTNVTLRLEPDENAPTAGGLQMGSQVEVIATERDWSSVYISGQTYYVPSATVRELDKYLIVIDPGHQAKGNFDKEPIGPGATEMKTKVAAGTQGVSTGIPEYQVTLAVSLKLRDELEARGYEVAMIRTTHDVNISNAERAEVANRLYADAFIRVHINGSEDSSVNGIVTICQTEDNPYNADLYEQSKELSTLVLDEMAAATGAKRLYVWEVDTMSGINWCQVPVTIVEMGFMSNPTEDALLVTEEYQDKLVEGMANGIDKYFE